MKRILDITLTLISSPLWCPVFLVSALAVLLAEGRPIFFSQERTGWKEKPFRLLKLRTMRQGDGTDAERTTRLGRFLRKTSIDELPELFHVLSGKMSLVGPRPLPVRYLERYSKEQRARHSVRPGITGWAQIHGRNATTWKERLAYDIEYVKKQSLWLDIKILFSTVFLVLSAKGIDNSSSETMPEFQG